MRAEKELGADVRFIEPGDGSDREAGLRLLAAEKMDLVIGVGFIFTDDLTQLAKEYPERQVRRRRLRRRRGRQGNPMPPPPNLAALKFREEEGSFLVGALAALVGNSKKVGFVGGMDIPLIHKFEAGYRAGVKHVCADCTVVVAVRRRDARSVPESRQGQGARAEPVSAGRERHLPRLGLDGARRLRGGAGDRQARHRRRRRSVRRSAGPRAHLDGEARRRRRLRHDPARARKARSRGGVYPFGLAEDGVGYVYDDAQPALIPDAVRARVEQLAPRSSPAGSRSRARDDADPPDGRAARSGSPTSRSRSARCWRIAAPSLEVQRGEIHALVGENGAGKSTLMRILSGMYGADAGDDRGRTAATSPAGRPPTRSPPASGMVHQHFMLVPTLTVAENVVLGREPTKAGSSTARAPSATSPSSSRATGLAVRPAQLVADLSVGEAQRVEILKTLYRGARILILDEPTAVLSPARGRRALAGAAPAARPRRDDRAHHAQARRSDGDLRHDHRDAPRPHRRPARAPPTRRQREIARAMVGRDVRWRATSAMAPQTRRTASTARPRPLLEVRDLRVEDARRTTAVRRRVASPSPPARSSASPASRATARPSWSRRSPACAPPQSGTIRLGGSDVTGISVRGARRRRALAHSRGSPRARPRARLSDRRQPDPRPQPRFTRARHARPRRACSSNARQQIAAFDIRPARPARAGRATLSGGNQQKIVIAREMARAFQVLLAAQPTRGVDVGAIEFIHARLRDARDAGKAVLLVSAELAEMLALSDRIAVMYGGRIAVIARARRASPEVLGPYMTGAERVA